MKREKHLPIMLYIEDEFFHKAKAYLKHQTEKQLGIIQSEEVNLIKWELMTITTKKWSYSNDSIINSYHKNVVPKGQLYQVLCVAHNRTAHRGRQITLKWVNDNYSEINVKFIAIFVGLCVIHAEQQSINCNEYRTLAPD